MNPLQLTLRRFVQAGDDQQDDPGMPQQLEIESHDSGAGTFVRIATDRWVVETDSEIDELAKELKDALKVDVLPSPDP